MEKVVNAYNSIDKSLSKFRNLTLIISVGSIIACCFMGYLLYEQSSKDMWAVDKQGDIVSLTKINSNEAFKIEADNMIRMFYSRFFTYDKSNYKEQVELGLYLGGESVKRLYETYVANNWFNTIINNDIIVVSTVKDIQLEVTGSNKAVFLVKGEQELIRHNVKELRSLNIKGTVYAHPNGRVVQKNPHGLKIDNVVILENKVIGVNGENVE